jgi:DNA repair protein RecN (Recombination protein N)
MLAELRIRNYALIEDLTVEFGPGLNVLTGETGAGKSIILGALSLLLGERPDTDMIRTGADSATVEGRFEAVSKSGTELERAGIEPAGGTLILRRRIERTGRGAVYANDSGVTVSALAAVGDRLVDLHGQHQHQLLLRPEVHLDILDDYAGLGQERRAFAAAFHELEAAEAELARLDRELSERRARRDLTDFQLKELADAHVRPDEPEDLHRERELLQSTERRFSLVRQLEELLSEREGSIAGLLAGAGKALAELAALDPGLADRKQGLAEAQAVADELWRHLVRYRETIEFSSERLDEVNGRLFLIEKLERKYGVPAAGLAELEGRLRDEIGRIELDGTRRDELSGRLSEMRGRLSSAADVLSRKRGRARRRLEESIRDEFSALGLGRAGLSVSITRTSEPGGVYECDGQGYRMTEAGVDSVEFLFSANPGEELKPLRKVASGGELSRIMLALKGVLVQADPVPTMVFDEVDVGIGGRVAEAVGRRLSRLARSHQVVCITHLPQIAKYAETHLLVSKSSRGGRTQTGIRQLGEAERVEELARMSAGATVTRTGLAHAREMLESAARNRHA